MKGGLAAGLILGSATVVCPQSAFAKLGPPPTQNAAGPIPDDYDTQVREYLNESLKDPMSAQIQMTRLPRVGAHIVDRGLLGKSWSNPAWWVCYRVNAKNSYGGYTGFHTYMFAFVNDQLVGSASSPDIGYGGIERPVIEVETECDLPANSRDGVLH